MIRTATLALALLASGISALGLGHWLGRTYLALSASAALAPAQSELAVRLVPDAGQADADRLSQLSQREAQLQAEADMLQAQLVRCAPFADVRSTREHFKGLDDAQRPQAITEYFSCNKAKASKLT